MKTKFKLIYNRDDKVSEIVSLLEEIRKSRLHIEVNQEIIADEKHADAIKEGLWRVSVLGKMKIRQTKSGLLYPHLLVYRDDDLSTFYPRRRKGEPDTTIREFLTTVLTQNQRENLVASFYKTGSDCLESARFLYRNRKTHGRYEVLLTHGIESLLTSFIIFKEAGDPLRTIETLKRYRHEYKKFYGHCKRLDDTGIFKDQTLESIIHDMSTSFFPSTIDARYPKVGLAHPRFMPSYFPILKRNLSDPLGRLLGLE